VYAFVRLLPILLGGGAIVGWFIGGLTGAVRRDRQPDRPLALIDVVDQRGGQRRWFTCCDDSGRAGMIAGLLCGGLLIFATLSNTYSGLTAQAPQLGVLVRNVLSDAPGARQLFNVDLANALSPLVAITTIGFGALAILILRDPPQRFLSRVGASIIAGSLVGLALYFNAVRAINMMIGLARYSGFGIMPPDELARNLYWIGSPGIIALAYFMLPLIAGCAIGLSMSTIGAAQGIFYGLLLPIVFRRPIDHAASIGGRLRDDPDQFLPQVYNLYNRYSNATDILPHLAFSLRRRQLDMQRAIAAYHLASTQTDRSAEAVSIVTETLKAHDSWRWRNDIGALYRILNAGLAARTLDQVADIEPMPEAQTASLPPMLARAGETLTRTLNELKKVGRVDDLNSKTILLNNSLDAIHAGQRHADAMKECWLPASNDWSSVGELWRNDPNLKIVEEKFKAIKGTDDFRAAMLSLRTVEWRRNVRESIRLAEQIDKHAKQVGRHFTTSAPYPETIPLRQMLDHWQELVMSAVKDLQGRAALVSSIKTRQLNYAASLPVTITLKNEGLNIAESVRFTLKDGEGYRVTEGGQQRIDLLTAGSDRDIEVTIEPRARDRVRLVWQLTYDDAVDEQRQVEFADVIEFVREEIQPPFVRIFPIPYVTGMPLKTGHLFVGREDVFAYIKEHLFGAYQNNVIVLHGQRRTGKTSILYRLKTVLADTHVCVLVDMQGKAARGMLDFLYSLADDIVYELEDRAIAVTLPPRSDFAESPEFVFRSRFLRSVYEVLPQDSNGHQKHLLLMFDEFEELQKRVQDGKLEPEIFPFLRNLMQHEDLLDFVFAGTHKLEELGAEYWSILFNIASYNKITFLTPDDARRLITEPVAPHIEYDPLAIERIIDVSGGHPYFTQVICHELVAYHNESQRSYFTANDVEEVLDRIVERGEAHFKFIWAESTPIEQAVLLALADLLETDETAGADEVQAVLDKRAIDLNGASLTSVLDNLEMSDILTRSGPRSSLYRFKIDLIRRWIYATRPS